MESHAGINVSILRLLSCCPHLRAKWQQERLDRMDEDPSNPLVYMQAAALAQIVVDAYIAADRDWLQRFFAELEELLTDRAYESDHELLFVGVIEDLEKAIRWAQLDVAPFYQLLGPESRSAWDGVVAMWEEIGMGESGVRPGRGTPRADLCEPPGRRRAGGASRPVARTRFGREHSAGKPRPQQRCCRFCVLLGVAAP